MANLELKAWDTLEPELDLPHAGSLDTAIRRWWADSDDPLAAMCRHALLPTGKLVRPILLIEAGLAVGGQVRQLLPAAIGTEFGHVASLIHDDIIDGDETRRGRPSVHARYGVGNAIVAGDALFFALFRCLSECHSEGTAAERVVRALRVVSTVGVDLCRGQILEAAVTADLECTPEQYYRVIRSKTAALFRGSCACGAILGGGCEQDVAALSRYGENLGVAFQITDDLLPYTSDSARTGKPATSDLRNKRVTLPVIRARQLGGHGVRAEIDRLFSQREPGADDLGRLRDLVVATGAAEEALGAAKSHVEQAQESLHGLPDTLGRRNLARISDLAVSHWR